MADETEDETIGIDDIFEALPRLRARFVVLKISLFIVGCIMATTNVILIMNTIFVRRLLPLEDPTSLAHTAVLFTNALAEILGYAQGILLLFGADLPSKDYARKGMILSLFVIGLYWVSHLVAVAAGLPFSGTCEAVVMNVMQLVSLFFASSFYFFLGEQDTSDVRGETKLL